MTNVLSIGPVAIPLGQLVVVVFLVGLAFMAEHWSQRRDGGNASWVWLALLIGLTTARAGYVFGHWPDFATNLPGILAVWQGGFSLAWGIIGAAIYTLWRYSRSGKTLRGVGLAVVMGGLLAVGGILMNRMPSVGAPLPDISLLTLEGKYRSLDGFTGRPVVLNLWASWCPPCRQEMPVLAQAQQDNPDTVFVFVNQGESPRQINQFLTSMGLRLDNVMLDGRSEVATYFTARGLPTTLFFDSQGKLVTSHVGELSRAVLNDYLRRLHSQ